MWRHLTLTALLAEYRTERACQLPEYLGSTFRGVFGHELHALSCMETASPCDACRRPDRCAAGALFDSHIAGRTGSAAIPTPEPASGAAGFDQPRPYVLAPPSRNRGTYSAGDSIRFGITLVGRARVWHPWVIAAMAGVGRRGLGVERQKLALVRLTSVGPAGAQTEINLASFGIGACIPELEGGQIVAESPSPSTEAIVAFLTPADLKRKGQRIDRLDGPTFFRRLIRRIGTLVESYCAIPPDAGSCDFHALGALADQVTAKEQDVSMQTWERYSNRLEGKHPLSGLVGRALLSDIPEPLWPYLILGQWVHVGKSAGFGQGRYIVLPQDEQARKETL